MTSVGTSTASLCSEELDEFNLSEPTQLLSDFGDNNLIPTANLGSTMLHSGHEYPAVAAKLGPPDDPKIKSLSDTDVVASQKPAPDNSTRLKTSYSCGSCISKGENLRTATNNSTSENCLLDVKCML